MIHEPIKSQVSCNLFFIFIFKNIFFFQKKKFGVVETTPTRGGFCPLAFFFLFEKIYFLFFFFKKKSYMTHDKLISPRVNSQMNRMINLILYQNYKNLL
jgi:hypothetical protein